MKNLTLYRILTWFLLIVAGFLSFALVTMLVAVLANPLMLMPLLLFGSLVVYSISSWNFLRKAIDAYQYCKPSLRDTIRITGSVALFLAVVSFANSLTLLIKPEMLDQAIGQAMEMQNRTIEGMETMARQSIRFMVRFMLFYSVALFAHVVMTFRLLRKNADAFDA